MVDIELDNCRENAELLLKGLWYSELPDLLDVDELVEALDIVFEAINTMSLSEYKQDEDGFITDWKKIVSPPYIRSPGVEAITFFEFKKNKSLREMQIPNLRHYISFMYNSLFVFPSLFEELYINPQNACFTKNSNSYLVFENEFLLHTYDGEEAWSTAGTFTTKNNKINSSAILTENKRRLLTAERDYLYTLKLDIESFFPNIYTHNFEKIAQKEPFLSIDADSRFFRFLDQFHQRINNNQTKGIPAGVFSSHVAAELCMLSVDNEIRKYIEERGNAIGYIRYVDDLTFYSDSESELNALLPQIQTILNNYRLRINGNKTETMRSLYVLQPFYLTEIEQAVPQLGKTDLVQSIDLSTFYTLKRYIGECLKEGRVSQLRALLSILLKKIEAEDILVSGFTDELFFLFLKTVFEDVTLTSHIYRLLDLLLVKAVNKTGLLSAMYRKKEKIDREYPDTLLQIWHYYVLFKHVPDLEKKVLILELEHKPCNPLLAATMVMPGKKNNKELFRIIKEHYEKESKSTDWKAEIMNSKWWLPLFKIARYDSHNYEKFMQSKNFPEVLQYFVQLNG